MVEGGMGGRVLDLDAWPLLPPFPVVGGQLHCPKMIAMPHLVAHDGSGKEDGSHTADHGRP
eukprot:3501549-Karenia_brevis.AAC.1